MSVREISTERVIRSAIAVVRASREFSDARRDVPATAEAADRLAATIEYRLADLSRVEVSGFVPPGAGVTAGPERPAEVLGLVAAQLRIGEVALAAAAMTGETAPVRVDGFDEAVDGLSVIVGTLDSGRAGGVQGFAPQRRHSADQATAVAAFAQACDETLGVIAERTADALGRPLQGLSGLAPEAVRRAWEQVDERLRLDQVGNRLVQVGLRAVAAALGALHRLVRGDWVGEVQQRLTELAGRVGALGVSAAAVGGLLGVAKVKTETGAIIGLPGLEVPRLDAASDALTALAAGFTGTMEMVALAQTAITGLGAVTMIGLTVPHLGAVLLGAELTLGALVVALALDYMDTLPALGWVRGVRTIIRRVAQTP
ncbi:hypothetical protein [Actinoplanes sp. NPDC051851]|uniref:hypothetical protein n=1 Tax=Actinoplanes sp. NPDC051851 TaxID=3154753 RepID=UPI003441C3D2